jgi:hypothetical protein
VKNSTLILSLIVVLVLATGVFWFISNKKTASPVEQQPATTEPSKAFFLGSYVCLPHESGSGPQTLECAYGLKDDDGSFYALDTSSINSNPPLDFKADDKIEVHGTLTPVEKLNSDNPLQKYDIKGVIRAIFIGKVDTGTNTGGNTVSTNGITFQQPSDFRLATTTDQILVKNVIPP